MLRPTPNTPIHIIMTQIPRLTRHNHQTAPNTHSITHRNPLTNLPTQPLMNRPIPPRRRRPYISHSTPKPTDTPHYWLNQANPGLKRSKAMTPPKTYIFPQPKLSTAQTRMVKPNQATIYRHRGEKCLGAASQTGVAGVDTPPSYIWCLA